MAKQKDLIKREINKKLADCLKIKEMMQTDGWKIAENILKDLIINIIGGVDDKGKIHTGKVSTIKDKEDLHIWLARKEALIEFYNRIQDMDNACEELKKQLTLV